MRATGNGFAGTIGRTVKESKPDWPGQQRAPESAPNIIWIVLDDVGYAQLGCYGSDIQTPNIDRLAAEGLQYTDFHTTALCSPTRSCLLTGRNHHSVGMGCITEGSTGYPGYNAEIPKSAAMLPQVLQDNGYSTYAVGKWHMTPTHEETPAGPYHRWPLGQGFERFYGFLGGETNQWYPDLIHDNHQVEPPRTPEEGYHLTDDLTDKSMGFIRDQKNANPDKPFFLYYSTGACHAPHHAPKEFINRYRGKFDQGWDKWREQILDRQKKMGVVPENTQLSPRPEWVQEWESLSADEKKVFSRMMEVYAGFLEHTDHNIGKLISFLEANELKENTLICLISDNGASAEGGELGSINENRFFNYVPETIEENLEALEDLGGPKYFNHYPWGWTLAGNTPLKRWKRETHQGGITDPLIINWPRSIKEPGLRRQYHHVVDIVPTIMDLLELKWPEQVDGVTQTPLEGESLAYSLNDGSAPTRKRVQYYEMLGQRAIWANGWKAVSHHQNDSGQDFESDNWELYNLTEDFSECDNLAKSHTEKLDGLIALWWEEAEKYNVLPLDDRLGARLGDWRPGASEPRKSYTYLPDAAPIPESSAAGTHNRSHTISADVDIPKEGAEGVLISQGSRFGGYTMFVQDGRLHYSHNYVGVEEYKVSSTEEVPEGHSTLRFEFTRTGENQGDGTLFINDREVGRGHLPHTVPFTYALSGGGLLAGRDDGVSVSKSYQSPFNFTGTLNKVVVEVGEETARDSDAEARAAMTKQ